LFCDTPEKADNVDEWEHQLVKLLAGTKHNSFSPCKAVKDIAFALEDTYWQFSRISRYHGTVNLRSDAERKDTSTVSFSMP
jgi:hypothetical protein